MKHQVKVWCGWCRRSNLLPGTAVTVHPDPEATRDRLFGEYRFVCRHCDSPNFKPATGPQLTSLLAKAACRVVWPVPHPEHPPSGLRPLTRSDVHNFVIGLETGEVWDELDA